MLPLAVLLIKSGMRVLGSDRSYDQGKTPDKFSALLALGIELFPQDGSGVCGDVDVLVVSSAVEDTIPDVRAALDSGLDIIKRGALLAQYFNSSEQGIAVAGTSGKSTVTGMIGTILLEMDCDPSVVNGGEIRNFRLGDGDKFSGVRKGRGETFVAEMDESDGSIAYYDPFVAVLNNVALDHMAMDELEELFGAYLARARNCVIVNFDQPRVKGLCEKNAAVRVISYAINHEGVDLKALALKPNVHGIDFVLRHEGQSYDVSLNVPGRHNVENALAALSVCVSLGLDIAQGVKAISSFKGIHRRMEYIGEKNGISVLDDFGHNPDKISASLQTLKAFDGRLIVMFQPHGFGPLRLMRRELVEAFSSYLGDGDILIMPEVYYAGGTVDRSVTAKHLIGDLNGLGVNARWFEARDEIPAFLKTEAKSGDRVVIMGARDDTLHIFAKDVLALF